MNFYVPKNYFGFPYPPGLRTALGSFTRCDRAGSVYKKCWRVISRNFRHRLSPAPYTDFGITTCYRLYDPGYRNALHPRWGQVAQEEGICHEKNYFSRAERWENKK